MTYIRQHSVLAHQDIRVTRMPLGCLMQVPSFCHLMEMCLGDQQYLTLLFYLDDICIFGSSIDEMLDRIGLVFQCLKEFNLKIKPKKSYFFQSNVLFLGTYYLKRGFHQTRESEQGKGLAGSKNGKRITFILGLASYYQRFIPQFAKWASPLHDLIHPVANRKKHVGRKLPPLPQNLPPFK